MSKGVVLHLENDKVLLDGYQDVFMNSDIDLEFIPCLSEDEFNEQAEKHKGKIKSIIFDLVGSKATEEELAGNPEFLNAVRSNFAIYNLPIFIYTARLDLVKNDFNSNGSVVKLSKDDSIAIIFDKIKLYLDSGFIDVFCAGGILEKEINDELHKSFTNQFSKNSEIEEVIRSILYSETEGDKSQRVRKIFKRITIKTLASDLLAPIADSEDKVHPIEHFYKRQSKLDIWTGDIWKQKDGDKTVLVLTPRCDFATGKAKTLIYCLVEKSPIISLTGKPDEIEKRLRNYLTDNLPGKVTRYIPSNVFFPDGGMVNLALHETKIVADFLIEYNYVVTLSDELANEIIGKLAYYFLRTGITNINEQEFQAIVKAMNSKGDAKK